MKRALLGMLVLLGCRSPVAPLTGEVYVLSSIAGTALPARFAENPAVTQRIVADTIAFVSETSGERRTVIEGSSEVSRGTFGYTRDGSHVEITFPCPPNANCIAGPHIVGNLTSSGFVSTVSRVSLGPLVYNRLYPPD